MASICPMPYHSLPSPESSLRRWVVTTPARQRLRLPFEANIEMKLNCMRFSMLICGVVGLLLADLQSVTAAEKNNILLIAGKPSHGYGSHEHYAGLKVLEESLNASGDSVAVTVVRGWWRASPCHSTLGRASHEAGSRLWVRLFALRRRSS
jgi:hypothetical protein